MPAIVKIPAAMGGLAVAALALALGVEAGRANEFGAFVPYAGAPDAPVAARDGDGDALPIGSANDRVTLVHFFASRCEPCADELPTLVAFVAARPARIRLIGVNVAEPASRAKKFAARLGFAGPLAIDEDKSVANAFRVRGLPATVAIAPGGERALAAAGPVDWASPQTAEILAGLGR